MIGSSSARLEPVAPELLDGVLMGDVHGYAPSPRSQFLLGMVLR